LDSKGKRYVIVTPVRDEENYIAETIRSVLSQTIRPLEWVIVDDGSKDRTAEIIDRFGEAYSWIKTIHRNDRGFRKSGGGVIEAFYDGYQSLSEKDWDFIVKLDGDLSFDPEYFEKCFGRFSDDPRLGIGGGTVWSRIAEQWINDGHSDPEFHVRGATKIYRRACWDKISPLVKAPGWDTIDEVKANMYGWATRTFPDVKLAQLRGTGLEDGRWHTWFKNGLANYVTGYHPIFMLGKCVKRALGTPPFLASLALLFGFCSGYLKGIPQLQEPQAISYLRLQQVRRLLMRPSIYSRSG
jgi:poly-beta-1,6-N-acetyl-D-glucosamine synthase